MTDMVSATARNPAALLEELLALPEERRLPRLRTEAEAEPLLVAMCEEVDRLAGVEISQALRASELVVALAESLNEPRARTKSRASRAMALAYAGQLDAALAVCVEAIAIGETFSLAVETARARLASVHTLAMMGRYDEAIRAGETARQAFVAAGEPSLAARADVSLGAVFDMREEPAAALRHYDRALADLADDLTVLAQIQTNRGIALIGLDEFRLAEDAFAGAVEAFTASGLDWAGAIAEGNLAYLAMRQGRLDRALRHFELARRCLEADESPADMARLLAEQADALALLGMPREAARLYERALTGLEAHGLAGEAAQARAGLGRVLVQLGRLEEAEPELDAASAALERLGQEIARARLDLVRAELAARNGRRSEARTLAEDALHTLALRPSDAILAHEQLAWRDLEAGEYAAAEAHVAAALPIAERLDLAPVQASLLHARGLARRGRGLKTEALADLSGAVEQIERVRGVLQAERFRAAFLGRHLALYEDAVLAALDSGVAVEDVFALVERAKSRALLDVVGGALDLVDAAESGASDPAEAELLGALAGLRGELNWHYGRFDDDQAEAPSLAEREEWRATIHRLETELAALEDRLAAAGGIAGLYAPPVELDTALGLVPDGGALIEYFAAGDEVMALVLRDGEAAAVRHLASAADLREQVSRVHFQIGRAVASMGRELPPSRAERQLDDARRELLALHDLLIAPLASRLERVERLLIVPHGALHTLPFQALWDGRRYLIETFEVGYAPSASVLAHLAPGRKSPSGVGAIVVGVPDGLAPWIGAEAVHVAAALGVEPVLGPDATKARVAREAGAAGIVHLACHGRFSQDRPLASGLKLADGWLTVRDVYALRLGASLVTLSGCETGRTAVDVGDELMGLMRGFFAAGARALLISLWAANDESTSELMRRFYDAFRSGVSPATALRDAQRAQLARTPHPAHWAPFIFGGHG